MKVSSWALRNLIFAAAAYVRIINQPAGRLQGVACGNNMSECGDSSLIIPGPKSKCGRELMSNVTQNLTVKLRITHSYDDLRLCARIMNSASVAARASGGNISALSLRSPDIEMASSSGLSMEGVVAPE